MTSIIERPFTSWEPQLEPCEQQYLAEQLESGGVLFFPKLSFSFAANELHLLDLTPSKAKNISFNLQKNRLGGIDYHHTDKSLIEMMMSRYVQQAQQLVSHLFPQYMPKLETGLASLRTVEAKGRTSASIRKDDARLHIDAFPSRPTQGKRLLRVFCNINQADHPRVWKVGESFPAVAKTFLPKTKKYSALSARFRNVMGITKTLQTQYDFLMLQLHHLMKADDVYQAGVAQREVAFPPGSTWIVFSDQVSHAVLSGQHMMEQTFYVPVEAMYTPEMSPLKILERLQDCTLV